MPELQVFGVGVTLLADGAATRGTHTIARLDCPDGAGAPPHFHMEEESFLVVEGSLEILLDGTWHRLNPGDFMRVPSGATHAFRNPGPSMARVLDVAVPAGHDAFFRAADELHRTGRFNPETAAAVCAATGITLVTE